MPTTTPHHALPFPLPTDAAKPRVDIGNLATSVDTKFPKITYGTGAAPTTGMRDGDIHLQYPAATGFDENVALDSEE